MTNRRAPLNRHEIIAKRIAAMHDHYVRAINSAVQDGRDHDVSELAAAYAKDARESAMATESAH
jgi:hypothetical protein